MRFHHAHAKPWAWHPLVISTPFATLRACHPPAVYLGKEYPALKHFLALGVLVVVPGLHAAEALPQPLVSGLKNPTAAAVGTDGKVYIATQGDPRATGDGQVLVLDNGKAVPFARGLENPQALVAFREWL